jgi:hypothetical protein
VTVGDKDEILFVAAHFIDFRFLATQVVCELSSKRGLNKAELTLDVCVDNRWVENFQKAVARDENHAVFNLARQTPSITALRIARRPVQTRTAGLINVFRLDSIKVKGTFLPGI